MHAPHIYPSRIDGALVLLMLAPQLGALGMVAVLASRAALFPGRGLVLAALLASAVLALWVLLVTRYTLDGATLTVRSGPFSWVIALKDIRAVGRTDDRRSAPALSLRRLRIEYGAGRAIMVSPREEAQFLADLRARGVPTAA